jgi:uncharacterized phiE125 gp8 family phage protein
MSAALITPPAIEPVTLPEAKAHLKIAHNADDTLVGALITAARVHVETTLRRLLVDQSWRIYCDTFPSTGRLSLPFAPIREITKITVYDADGDPTTLPSTSYVADLIGAPARLAFNASVPRMPGKALNGIEIDVKAGYGPSGVSVPQPLREAIMMLVARWYDYRDSTVIGTVPPAIASAYDSLVAPYRLVRLT